MEGREEGGEEEGGRRGGRKGGKRGGRRGGRREERREEKRERMEGRESITSREGWERMAFLAVLFFCIWLLFVCSWSTVLT